MVLMMMLLVTMFADVSDAADVGHNVADDIAADGDVADIDAADGDVADVADDDIADDDVVDFVVAADAADGDVADDARSLTLDTNSAHDLLQVSLDLRMVTRTGVSQHRPHHPHRFDLYPQSLCRESFSSGRHYWEVDVEGAESCRVGVVYGMIPRKGRDAACRLGGGDASWSLVKDRDCFSVRHAGEATPLLVAALPQRVGVHLDWEGGVLQFYREDTGDILCTLHHRFTQPLFPALGVWRVGDSVSIVDFP
ncbi:unnamed protein product [Lampetra fluviatilis]